MTKSGIAHLLLQPLIRIKRKPLATLVIASSAVFSFVYTSSSFAQSTVSPLVVEPQAESIPAPTGSEDVDIDVEPVAEVSDSAGPIVQIDNVDVFFDAPDLVSQEIQSMTAEFVSTRIEEKANAFSFADLSALSNDLTNFLRNNDYLLATAILPPQNIENNTLYLRVLVGRYQDISTVGNQLYRDNIIQESIFLDADSHVSKQQVEEQMLRLNDLPGFYSSAVFRTGRQVGKTAMQISVNDEDAFAGYVRLDNYGLDSTGDIRFLAGIEINNISGHRDQFTLDAVQTFNKGDVTSARARYEITSSDLVHSLGIAYSETIYDVKRGLPASAGKVDGKTRIGDLYVKSRWLRSPDQNFTTILSLAAKRTEQGNSLTPEFDGRDKLSVGSITAIYDAFNDRYRYSHRASLSYRHGIDSFLGSMDGRGDDNSLTQLNSTPHLPGGFESWFATYSNMKYLSPNHSLWLRLQGLYSEDPLSSLEKMSLGGPYSVRGYPIGETVGEKVSFASLAWVMRGSIVGEQSPIEDYDWGDILTVSLFVDYGEAKDRLAASPSTTYQSGSLSSWGIDGKITLPEEDLFFELTFAQPLGAKRASNGDDFQIWVALEKRF